MTTAQKNGSMAMALCAITIVSMGIVLAGCASADRGTRAHSEDRNMTGDDWIHFAVELKDSMLQNKVLDRYAVGAGPVTLAIGDFNNKTSRLDMMDQKDIMYNEIKRTFVNTGRIQVNRELVGTGGNRDSLVAGLKGLAESEDYDRATTSELTGLARAPRLVLYGEIIEKVVITKDGDRQVEFFANCELIDVKTRGAVWTDQFRIKKLEK